MASDAAEWIELQNRFYRIYDVYRMQWENVDLVDCLVACAPFGGPIATVRDPSRLVAVGLSASLASLHSTVSIFSAAGVLLSSFPWNSQDASLVYIGWTRDLNLVLVAQDGSIVQFTLQGNPVPGRICLDSGLSPIVHVSMFGGRGVASLTEDLQLYIVPNVKYPEVISLSPPELTVMPKCLLGLCPALSPAEPHDLTRGSSPLDASPGDSAALTCGQGPDVAAGDGEVQEGDEGPPPVLAALPNALLILAQDECTEIPLPGVEAVALSPSGKLLGCFTSDGVLHVITCGTSYDLVSEFDTNVQEVPSQMVWCGEDALLAYWRASGNLLLVGPGDSASFPAYEDRDGVALVLSPEVDGARVLSAAASSFVQRVPDLVVAAYGIGSTEPPALLVDAYDQLEKRSVKADESVRLLGTGETMSAAVDSCAEASCYEPTVASQQLLLQASAYGRAYCRPGRHNRDHIRHACMVLRVLNALHDVEATGGLPVTFGQFRVLGPARLVGMLLAYHRHLLALRISHYLGLPAARVLQHWATAKIAASTFLSDDDLYATLMSKLQHHQGLDRERGGLSPFATSASPGANEGVSFAAIAEVAHVRGRGRLAARLLEHEVHEEKVVRLLLRMKQYAVALRRAEHCVDTDLLYLVIFQIQAHLPEESLFLMMQDYPVARQLFISHFRQHDRDLLRRFLVAWGQPHLVAELLVEDCVTAAAAGAGGSHDSGAPWTPGILKELEGAAALFEATKGDHHFQSASVQEWVRLMRCEHKGEGGMAASTRALVQGKTVSDALYACATAAAQASAAVGSGPGAGAGPGTAAGAGAGGTLDQQQVNLLQQLANRLRYDMKVPDRRLYWIKLRAMARAEDWAGLEKFSKERRPPIGLRPFAEACIDAGAIDEAAKYIARIHDASEKEELLRRIGLPGQSGTGSSGSTGDLLGSLRSSLSAAPTQAASSAASAFLKGWGFG